LAMLFSFSLLILTISSSLAVLSNIVFIFHDRYSLPLKYSF
jgi:hypothetical protein